MRAMNRLARALRPTFAADSRDASVTADRFPVASAGETLRHLRTLVRGRGLRLGVAVTVLIGAAWCGVLVPKLMGGIVDVVAGGGTTGDIGELALRMVAAAIGSGVLSAVGFTLVARLAETAIADLREDMVATALGLPVERVERAGAGDVVSRATDDVAQVSASVTQTLPIVAGAAFTVLVSIAGVGSVDWRFMVAFLIVAPVHVIAVRGYLRTAPAVFAAERGAMGERARTVLSTIHGLPAVRAFGLAASRRHGIADWSWKVVRHGVDARITNNIIMARMHLAEYLGMASTLVLGFYLVRAGHTTIGGATAAMLLFMRLFAPLTRMVMVLDVAQSGATSLTRIVGVFAERRPEHADADPDPSAGVELRGVNFSYGRGIAVTDVDLIIAPGETVALVGSSGAGKSTLAAIVAGLRIADSGTVSVGGQDLTVDAEAARGRTVALVTQEVHVFEGALRDDLTLAAPDADDAAVVDALERVGADWFHRLPDGLDTIVGLGGHRLDPVAAQQVALARVLLSDPPVIVLDEATAEAGSVGADSLADAADEVTRDRTALIVAHRLDQAAAADRIVVMEGGRIVESGPHADLVAAGGRYATLWAAWSEGRRKQA
ncbi:ABC transporter ATP-binding protein [Corynebacterium freneyi]|uniref:ATP-binding cassette subfamily C protein n=1 Tax=Corynebacterium freneyi TaxID=134034 RepID=A0ABS4U874_9CORY|nr:ABC transporter ATP-binding protein [Corynebacterium freneyi]MBP2332864.1 ATP-binding cassette subfamily C protein [Corynebacterium freneyi]WJZ05031.1 Lipid A export ATP-binding/permease protein MsbA [Corynebacterium freneyi]